MIMKKQNLWKSQEVEVGKEKKNKKNNNNKTASIAEGEEDFPYACEF